MPGPLVHVGAVVQCPHGGVATPSVPNPRVVVSAQPSVLLTSPWVIAGCSAQPPCVSAQYVAGSTRVTSNFQPLVVQLGQAVCVPTGAPLVVSVVQPRVVAL
jgi:hypothetical protein